MREVSAEAREKMSRAHKGKLLPDEHCAAISRGQKEVKRRADKGEYIILYRDGGGDWRVQTPRAFSRIRAEEMLAAWRSVDANLHAERRYRLCRLTVVEEIREP